MLLRLSPALSSAGGQEKAKRTLGSEWGFTEGAEGALDFGADFLAGVDVFDDDLFESGEVFVSLSG
jgi:hypothetical protein